MESLRAEAAAATNVPVPPSSNVEAEFRRMQRVIDEMQAELARFRSREVVGGTEVDEDEDEGAFSTDLSHTRKSRRLGPGAPSTLLELLVDRDRVKVWIARS